MLSIVPVIPVLVVSAATTTEFHFHEDYVLGTSMDLVVGARNQRIAAKFYDAVTAEVTRLAAILNTHNPESEISRLQGMEKAQCSPELTQLLALYDYWEAQTLGAIHGRMGGLIAAWKQAGRDNSLPAAENLAGLVAQTRTPGWQISAGNVVTRLSAVPWNVDAIGKGFIVDRALQVAGALYPEVTRAMLNIGGEIACKGKWTVEVADPANPADNQPGQLKLELEDQAIATSGGYARYALVDATEYSHIIDPNSGWPVGQRCAATVIADDCTTANALATALCVLPVRQGLALADQTPKAGAIVTDSEGRQYLNGHQPAKLATSQPVARDVNPNWPAGYSLQVKLTLPEIKTGKRAKRPYVAVWIMDEQGKAVRTLAIWGKENKYWKDLKTWWGQAGKASSQLASVSKASRMPGEYRLAWDGKNEAGKFVPAGTYTVNFEAAREKGGDEVVTCKIVCGQNAAHEQGSGHRELADVAVDFGGPQ